MFEEFKISDIYFGNYRIDVITLYKEKNIKIPKTHVEMDILPHFYFVVQIGAKIKEAKIIGFIEGKNIPACSHDSKFYYPTLNMVVSIERFIELTKHSVATRTTLGKHTDCLGLFLKFMDNDLSSVYKRQLIQHLMNCDSCRTRFIDTLEFEKLANNLRFYPNLLKKSEEEEENLIQFNNFNSASLEESLESIEVVEDNTQNSEKFINIEEKKQFTSEEKSEEKPKTVQMFDLIEKNEKKLLNKKVIDSIFNEIPKIELPPIKTMINAKNKRTFIVILATFIVLSSFALISLKGTEAVEEMNEMAQVEEYNELSNYNEDEYFFNDMADSSMLPELPTLANIENEKTRQPITTKPTYSPSIAKVSFEAPSSIVNNNSYTKFLQSIGKTIKLNLQNDLLLINDIPINKMAKVDIQIAANGTVNSIKVTYSSGSKMIDDAILKVVKETLIYSKPPSHGIVAKPAIITLGLDLK